MTAKEKIEKIAAELVGIDSLDMTKAELKIRNILEGRVEALQTGKAADQFLPADALESGR